MSYFQKIKLYPHSKSARVWSYIFIILIIAYIWLIFESYLTGEIRMRSIVDAVANEKSSTITTIISLLLVIACTSFVFLKKIKNNNFNRVFVIAIIDIIAVTLLTISVDYVYIISMTISSSLWLFLYWGWYGVFYGIEYKRFNLSKYVIIAFLYCSFLFTYNYIVSRSFGLRNFHYIEINFLLTLLPFIFLLRKKLKIVLGLITAVLVILSAKRASMLTFILMILAYMIYGGKGLDSKIKNSFSLIILSFVCFILLTLIFPENFEFIISRFVEIQEDGGSGRDDVYSKLYYAIYDQNLLAFIFGNGYNFVQSSSLNNGLSAHNDFLETTYDYGLVGLIIFFIIIVKLIKQSNNKSLLITERASYKMSIIVFLVLSMISHMTLHTTSIIWLMAFWAYIDVNIYKRIHKFS